MYSLLPLQYHPQCLQRLNYYGCISIGSLCFYPRTSTITQVTGQKYAPGVCKSLVCVFVVCLWNLLVAYVYLLFVYLLSISVLSEYFECAFYLYVCVWWMKLCRLLSAAEVQPGEDLWAADSRAVDVSGCAALQAAGTELMPPCPWRSRARAPWGDQEQLARRSQTHWAHDTRIHW